jgi:hypothetical protein
MLHSAGTWLGYNALFEGMSLLGVPRTLIRYEDLVSAPGPVLAGVLDRMGVSYTDADLAFISDAGVDLAPDHSFGGNPTRIRVGPVPLRLDEAWRTAMNPADRRIVGALTLPGQVRYGYPQRKSRG